MSPPAFAPIEAVDEPTSSRELMRHVLPFLFAGNVIGCLGRGDVGVAALMVSQDLGIGAGLSVR